MPKQHSLPQQLNASSCRQGWLNTKTPPPHRHSCSGIPNWDPFSGVVMPGVAGSVETKLASLQLLRPRSTGEKKPTLTAQRASSQKISPGCFTSLISDLDVDVSGFYCRLPPTCPQQQTGLMPACVLLYAGRSSLCVDF